MKTGFFTFLLLSTFWCALLQAEPFSRALSELELSVDPNAPFLIGVEEAPLVPEGRGFEGETFYSKAGAVVGQERLDVSAILPAQSGATLNKLPPKDCVDANCFNTVFRFHYPETPQRYTHSTQMIDRLELDFEELPKGAVVSKGELVVIWSDRKNARTLKGLVHGMIFLGTREDDGRNVVLHKTDRSALSHDAIQEADAAIEHWRPKYPDLYVTVHRFAPGRGSFRPRQAPSGRLDCFAFARLVARAGARVLAKP